MSPFSPKSSRSNQSPLLIIAGVSAVACLLAALFLLANSGKEAPKAQEVAVGSVPVLIPLQPIEAGIELEPSLFKIENRPAAQVGTGYLSGFEQIKGFYAASFIAAGSPLHSAYVTSKRSVNQIQSNIPDGYRAVTLGVDGTTSVEGWARPGAKVDVMLASTVAAKPVIRVIVQNAKVLSAGMQTEGRDPSNPPPVTVTLLVTADEAGKIQLASSSGTLSLALRGDEDTVESPEALTVTLDSILGGDSQPQPTISSSQGQVKVGGKSYQVIDGQLKPIE